jgi:hypothetical protein
MPATDRDPNGGSMLLRISEITGGGGYIGPIKKYPEKRVSG